MNCRHCHGGSITEFLDLGFAPPSNAYLTTTCLLAAERYYPLRLFVCTECWLVQTQDYARADELFNADYAYFSSTSTSWLKHATDYAKEVIKRLRLNSGSLVVEVAANDGYLLRNFKQAGIPCLGIEPTASTAAAAEALGIPVVREFFGTKLASRLATLGQQADLLAGNNVYAHVPDINDFTCGLKIALKKGGTITLEFPHLLRLIELGQFDTVYHEHFSYLSLQTVSRIFEKSGLRVFDVESLSTHGGSLRIFGCHDDDPRQVAESVEKVLRQERQGGLQTLATYSAFQLRADKIKDDLLVFLIDCKRRGHSVAAYGAAAKGNTLMNYAGIKSDLVHYVCDAAAAKQGKFMPGSHLPILPPTAIAERRPKYVLILPWNLKAEVTEQLSYIREWGGKFVSAVPELAIQ